MTRISTLAALSAAVAIGGLAIPAAANAACERQMAGTVIGGIGGALIGNSISRGGGGAVVGGIGGAVIGHELAGGCNDGYRRSYYRSRERRSAYSAPPAPRAVRYVYYDQYGNAVSSGPAPQTAPGSPVLTSAAYASDCRAQNRAFYDDRGTLIYRPVQVCAR